MLGLLVGFYVSKDVSLSVVVNADQLQMSWSMTRQQCINEDEPHRYGLAKLAKLPSLAKRGWGRFSPAYRGCRAAGPLQIPPAPLCERGNWFKALSQSIAQKETPVILLHQNCD
jgi:hypothetical protein